MCVCFVEREVGRREKEERLTERRKRYEKEERERERGRGGRERERERERRERESKREEREREREREEGEREREREREREERVDEEEQWLKIRGTDPVHYHNSLVLGQHGLCCQSHVVEVTESPGKTHINNT